MIVSISQPAYIPWLGYFDKVNQSDYHIVLDDVQIEKNTKTSFTNRNKIKSINNSIWLSIPIKTKKNYSNIINEVLIDNNINWNRKHFNSLVINYNKAPFFKDHADWLKETYARDWKYLNKFIRYYNKYLLDQLSIKTKFIYSSEMNIKGVKSDYILNLCKELKAKTYLSGPFGRDYLDAKKFSKDNIDIIYHDYSHPKYEQLGDTFIPYLSSLDLLFNHGNASLNILNKKLF